MSDHPPQKRPFLPARGNYRDLLFYKKAEAIYDITFRFCARFLQRSDRTNDQMLQAARSGKQNIAEGAKAALTSTQTELKLTNVARASLEELLTDYEDFLRTRDLAIWKKDSKEALYARKLGRTADESFETYREFTETRPAGTVANIALCLIHQTNYLLDRYLLHLEQDFVENGGIRERMTAARLQYRSNPEKTSSPTCNTRIVFRRTPLYYQSVTLFFHA